MANIYPDAWGITPQQPISLIPHGFDLQPQDVSQGFAQPAAFIQPHEDSVIGTTNNTGSADDTATSAAPVAGSPMPTPQGGPTKAAAKESGNGPTKKFAATQPQQGAGAAPAAIAAATAAAAQNAGKFPAAPAPAQQPSSGHPQTKDALQAGVQGLANILNSRPQASSASASAPALSTPGPANKTGNLGELAAALINPQLSGAKGFTGQ